MSALASVNEAEDSAVPRWFPARRRDGDQADAEALRRIEPAYASRVAFSVVGETDEDAPGSSTHDPNKDWETAAAGRRFARIADAFRRHISESVASRSAQSLNQLVVEASSLLVRELAYKLAIAEVREGVLQRLKALHEAATEEEIIISAASEMQLRQYLLEQLRPAVRPAITASEAGILTATWRDANGRQIGMQFRGDGWVHYFLFALTAEGAMETTVGRKPLAEMLPLVKHSGMTDLIFGDA